MNGLSCSLSPVGHALASASKIGSSGSDLVARGSDGRKRLRRRWVADRKQGGISQPKILSTAWADTSEATLTLEVGDGGSGGRFTHCSSSPLTHLSVRLRPARLSRNRE
jgi:hypothetical protein